MIRIVLDTNVLVSALLNSDGPPAGVLNLILSGKVYLLYDTRIVKEYKAVLLKSKFGFRKEWIDPLLDFIEAEGHYVVSEPWSGEMINEGDRKFWEAAISGQASCLVTGNRKHYPADERIISPAMFRSVPF